MGHQAAAEGSGRLPAATPSSTTCGELLRRYRRLAGLTQEELAARSGYSANYIGKLEGGRRRPPPAALEQLCRALGLGDAQRAALRVAPGSPFATEPDTHPMVGRDREMREIRSLLAGLGSSVLLLSGEPGIGKTRLLEEAAELGEQSGWRVVRGGCRRRAEDPYAPLTNALSASLAQLSSMEREAALRSASRLGLILPEFSTPGNELEPDSKREMSPAVSLPAEQERRLLFAAVADYLQAMAGEQGIMLVLDDLQWAGPDAFDLLEALLISTPTASLRLIGAYRDSETPNGSTLAGFTADLARTSHAQVLALQPLSENEATQLATQLIPESDAMRRALLPAIVRRAGGVPLFLMCYVEDLRTLGGTESDVDLPWTITQVIGQQLAALPKAVQELLGVISVVGREVGPGLLTRITGRSDDDVVTALETAVEARLLRESGAAGYWFAHELIRDTIEQTLSAGRRQLLHRRIGGALEHLPERQQVARAAEISWHFQEGDAPERAIRWTLLAGEQAAAAFAHGDATKLYGQAAGLARSLGDAATEADALERLGDELYRAGLYADAVQPLEQAGALFERFGTRDRHLGAIARAGEAYGFAGRATEGIARVLATISAAQEEDATETAPSPHMADLYASLCALYLHAGRWQDALTTAETAVSLAEATGNLRALCTAEISHGLALGLANRIAEQRLAFEHAAAAAEPLGDESLRTLAIYHQGVSYLSLDEIDEGERLVRRALHIADRAGLIAWSAFARQSLAGTLLAHGQWAEARSEAERAESDSRRLGPRPGAAYALVTLGRILLLQGERDEGLRYLNEASTTAKGYRYLPGLMRAHEVLAWQEVREGRAAEAVARLEPLLERTRATGLPWFPTVYARALLETGEVSLAGDALRAARDRTAASPSRATLPDILLQSARLAAYERRWDDAGRELDQGLVIARELGLAYDEALLLDEAGREQGLQGQVQPAREHLAEALAIFRHLGASPDVERVEHMLNAVSLPTS